MAYCNGKTHYWSDDSYDSGHYPCPGPERCETARLRLSQKENMTDKRPATKFEVVTQVVMTEYYEQRDDPPGRAPYGEHTTVLAESSKNVRPHEVSEAVRKVMAA